MELKKDNDMVDNLVHLMAVWKVAWMAEWLDLISAEALVGKLDNWKAGLKVV